MKLKLKVKLEYHNTHPFTREMAFIKTSTQYYKNSRYFLYSKVDRKDKAMVNKIVRLGRQQKIVGDEMIKLWINNPVIHTYVIEHELRGYTAVASAAIFAMNVDGYLELLFLATCDTCKNAKLGMFLIGNTLRDYEKEGVNKIIIQACEESEGFYTSCGIGYSEVEHRYNLRWGGCIYMEGEINVILEYIAKKLSIDYLMPDIIYVGEKK